MATTPIVPRYPLDTTGVSPNNKIEQEAHTLTNRPIRAIAPEYGAYFTESIVVRDTTNSTELVKNTDYYCAEMYAVPSSKYGKEICSIVVITNPAISSNVDIDYQALGGPWSYSQQAIVQMIDSLNLDNRPVTWDDIINKPHGFNPVHHLHDAGDVYGFEYVVAELERIRQAILLGDSVSHDLIYAYINNEIERLELKHDQDMSDMEDFMNNNFIKKNSSENGSIRIISGVAEVYANGTWRQFWPPLWQ